MDIDAGIRHYDVQVRENEGDWDDWLTAVDYTGATFVGILDTTYTFRIKATDNVSNTTTEWQVSQPTTVHGVTKYYTHGGSRVAMRRGDAVYYLNGDHLGSTSLTTDESGAVVSEVRYLPYGEERWTNGATPTDFTFTGQRNEAGFGLMDYNARYYSARLGRFISPDSIVPEPMSGGGFNRYRYARNNPLKYTDPSGHCVLCVVVVLTGVALILSSDQAINEDIVAAEAAEGRTDYRDTYPSHKQGAFAASLIFAGALGALEALIPIGVGGLEEQPEPDDNPLNDPDITKRPSYWRKGTIETLEERMPRDSDGDMRCLGCDEKIDRVSPDHYPTVSERTRTEQFNSREEFLDDYQDPDRMRGLCLSCNQSHRFEETPTEKLPYYDKYNRNED